MPSQEYDRLISDVKDALAGDAQSSFGIIGHTPLTYDLLAFFKGSCSSHRLRGVYCALTESTTPGLAQELKPLEDLKTDAPSHVIIASDDLKERLLEESAKYLTVNTRVLLVGYQHFHFRDAIFERILRDSLVPSLANGYPYTLVHIYQCLQNAARLNLDGVVVEFGIFKGGTTMLISRFIEELGCGWKVVGFDTFAGFPARRSVLDMYDHPDCVFFDERSVRQYLAGRNVEIVSGDIVTSAKRLADEKVVLAFMDTDNYTPAMAALDIVQERVVVGGAIVFDHFTGRNRFLYTLGERIAAKRLLNDKRYFNLHDTGVFVRQM